MALLQLQAAGWDIPLSVNVSPKQFRQADFVDKVKRVLKYTGAPSQAPDFRSDRRFADRRPARHDCTHAGNWTHAGHTFFPSTIFGTGYSSLAYLKRLPLYELKIDQRALCKTPPMMPMAPPSYSLYCRWHHTWVCASWLRGVETREQAEFPDCQMVVHPCRASCLPALCRWKKWLMLQKQIASPARESSRVY